MPRQIERLTHAVPRAGPGARAIAVYAEALSAERGRPDIQRAARERGEEGVACVDDAARAAVLFCRLWTRYRVESARVAARGLLRFLAWMQDEDGRFVNFILSWTGEQNRDGVTSYPGGPQWQARAIHALAWGAAVFADEPEWDARFRRGAGRVSGDLPYLDVRAVCVLAALKHWQATGCAASAERASAWSDTIAGQRDGAGRLENAAGVRPIHLWGHLQEAALVETGAALGRPDLVDCARGSAESLLLPAVEAIRGRDQVLPFDVSCVVAGLAAVGRATGDARYAEAAGRARSWFLGRNSAGRPVYDEALSLVYDGIDAGRMSRNSGAESNIEGALAFLD